MKLFRNISLVLMVLVMLVSLIACGGTASSSNSIPAASSSSTPTASSSSTSVPSDNKLKIGVLIYKYDDTYMSSVRQAMTEEEPNYKDVQFIYDDSKNDQGTQNDQIDVLIQQGANALAVDLVDDGAVDAVLQKAESANIPVIFFAREPSMDKIKSYEKASYVGTNINEAGILQGDMVAKLWQEHPEYDRNKDGVLQYVLLQGVPGNADAIARTKYCPETLVKDGLKIDQLGTAICNWDADQANTAVQAWLSKFGDKIEVIISNNDTMASGAISALQSAGYNNGEANFIPVVGVDATDEAKDLISKGFMSGTIKQDAAGMAKAVVEMAYNAAQGKDLLDGTDLKFDDSGKAVRIPYQIYDGK